MICEGAGVSEDGEEDDDNDLHDDDWIPEGLAVPGGPLAVCAHLDGICDGSEVQLEGQADPTFLCSWMCIWVHGDGIWVGHICGQTTC